MTSTFPPDEFDVEDPGTGRRGAHRARPNPLVAVVPLVLVTVAVVAIIVAAMTMLGGSRTPSAGVPGGGPDVPSQSVTGDEPQPSQTTSESAPPSPSPSAEPEPTVDLSLPVSVLNGTTTSGLAAAATEVLTAAGYNVVSTDNFDGDTLPTTVYYSTEDALGTAEAIAQELGAGQTELDDSRGEGVVVVLGDDYAP